MKKDKNVFHKPLKRLGQNFLTDTRTIDKIIAACQLKSDDVVLEIGPGFGALTEKIAPCVKSVHTVEKDKNLYDHLRHHLPWANTTFHHQDFLTFDFSRLEELTKVIGNLPYNISSPIIERLIQHRHRISDVFITVQLEFGKRLVAKPGGKDYSALSCIVQYYAEPKVLFKIKNTCFSPIPKVESCFVHIHFKPEPQPRATDEKVFAQLVQKAFQQRRKQLHNALSSLLPKQDITQLFDSLSLDSQARAEDISVADYVRIANMLATKTK